MATYTTIDPITTETGDPVTTIFGTSTADNFTNHEDRITTLESSATNRDPWILYQGKLSNVPTGSLSIQGIPFRIPYNVNILGSRIWIPVDGSAGTTEIDILVSSGAGYSTIFSTRPSVTFGGGDDVLSTNQVLSVTSLSSGQFIRMDLISKQNGVDAAVYFILDYEVV